ncbi:patatin-like phospholipase family protein [Danxiaibacter flavus]|uniref:Patatin-like phospholipase family protein n=1 Tax=Danxiaibacter flavus TaxID=3049108 RepID=A0ABV3ZDN8_9BACT|nr:patatin-like phospholipase family protein [Chitinophagaceae bacterium DXS]
MQRLLVTLFVVCFVMNLAAQNINAPKIGVTLSGGGAKGLAHIGILKAIDSAGIRVNYITGTSMGSIMGALYACGYSADTIEKIARSIDWELLLTNSSSLRSLTMEEKDEYNKYAVELPWVNHGFRFPSGVLESEELWLKFSELFFPVYKIKDFSKLPKGFRCIAADVSTGEAVVLQKGELVYAVRSSMAIPSVFTAVNYENRKLIDGGVVRNFPVTDAKKMGADFIIGSNVAQGLLPPEKIKNVFQILLQVAFFREDADSKLERQLCDIYVPHKLTDYTMGSFGSSDEIIDEGVKRGRELYPTLKHLADSLRAKYPTAYKDPGNIVKKEDSVYITAYEIRGLKQTQEDFFIHRAQFELNKYYTPSLLSEHIRKAFGTRYYQKIIYSLQPFPDGSAKIIFEVEENPLSFAKLGLIYNSFLGVSLVGNFTTRNTLLPYSRSFLTANIGENMRLKGEHTQFVGPLKNLSASLKSQIEQLNINSYSDFRKDGLYKQFYFTVDLSTQISVKRKMALGLGTRFETFAYKPGLPSKFELRGSNNFFNSYGFFKFNTLNSNIYPKTGFRIDFEAGAVYNQHPDLQFYMNGNLIGNQDSLGFSFNNYTRTKLNAEHYVKLSRKYVLLTQFQAGMNLNYAQSILNDFNVGGMNSVYRNQVTFAGLNEGTVNTSSVASLQLGLRYQMFPNLFLTAKANAGAYNFVSSNNRLQFSNASLLSGYSLSLGYNFLLGPLEVTAMYCDQSKQILPYINLGIPF